MSVEPLNGEIMSGEPKRMWVPTGSGHKFRAALNAYAGVGGVLLALSVLLAVTQDQFATYDNLLIVLETNAVVMVVGVGLTFVLLVGGIDLSLGGTVALSGVTLWELLKAGLPAGLAMVIVVVGATFVGFAVNGLLIGRVGLNFLVVTLGSASLYRGIALVRTKGQSKSLFTETTVRELGSGKLFGVSYLIVIAAVVFTIGALTLRYTGYGRMVYAVGGNSEAARLAGISVTAVRVSVYAISGGLAGLAALMDSSRLAAASPTAATGIELTAAAAVLLGGTSFMGGRGTLLGTLLGVLFLGTLQNGITLAGVSPFWSSIVSGVVLTMAVLLDRIRNGRATP
jgi:ribose transport system permease protein